MKKSIPESEINEVARQISELSVPDRITLMAEMLLGLRRAEALLVRMEQRLDDDNR